MSKRHRPPGNAFRSFHGKPFELLNALAQVVGKPSLIGDIATTLYDKRRQPFAAIIDSPVVDLGLALRRAPWRVLVAAISSIRLPSDHVWLEFIHAGARNGLLAENESDGTILVRRAQFLEGGAVGTFNVCVSVRPERTPPMVPWRDDWSQLQPSPHEDIPWARWFDANVRTLYASREKPSLEEDIKFLATFAIPDLALLAVACSPLVASAWVQFTSDGGLMPVAEGFA
jgi:hypothetical protein